MSPLNKDFDLRSFYGQLSSLDELNGAIENKPIYSDGDIEVFFDPVIGGFIAIGALLITELFLLDGIDREFGEGLDKVERELKKVNETLKRIEDDLNSLRVYLDNLPVREAKDRLQAAIYVFLDNKEEWKADLASQDNLSDMRHNLDRIQFEARNLMEKGFACYNTVAYAMRFESDLLKATRKLPDTRRKIFSRYITYFDTCLLETFPGSVANIRKQYEIEVEKLRNQFPDPFNRREYLHWRSWELGGWRRYGGAHIYVDISGSLERGFSAQLDLVDQREWSEPVDRPRPAPGTGKDSVGSDEAYYLVRSLGITPLASVGRDNALQASLQEANDKWIKDLNSYSAQYLNSLAQAKLVALAEEKVRGIKEIAQREHDSVR